MIQRRVTRDSLVESFSALQKFLHQHLKDEEGRPRVCLWIAWRLGDLLVCRCADTSHAEW